MSTKINLENIKRVHCVGIGGIGVSAIARLLLHRGAEVSGSDTSSSPVTEGLVAAGAEIFIGHDKEHMSDDVDLVVHTIAVPADNPELIAAKQLGIPVLTYPQMLGLLSQDMYTIAVSGTHGKTTTTAMLSEILVSAEKSPTVIVGSLLHKQNSNFISGGSDILVVEACEYRRSFLQLNPDILIITNIDADHLDYFKDLADIQSAFAELAAKVPEAGFIVCDPEDPRVKPAISGSVATVVDYTNVDLTGDLMVPGEHNKQNAKAAAAAAGKLDVGEGEAVETVRAFAGT
ncbi:MAG: Mur ligase domain-containing protein, partial [Candidatus Paceibacterota bacterium]